MLIFIELLKKKRVTLWELVFISYKNAIEDKFLMVVM